MKWEDIKTKLLSRKFWMMVTTFIGLILVAANIDVLTIEKLIGVITSFSILAIYILGETITDIANRKLTVGEQVVVSVAQKLSSRKFWAALISFITTLLFTLGVDILTIEQVEAMIMAIATVAVYILSESAIDASKIRAELEQSLRDVNEEKEELTNNIINQVVPSRSVDWLPMYIFAPNKVCVNVYKEPDYTQIVTSLPHMTQLYVEPGQTYGTAGNYFYRFVTVSSKEELFISVNEVVDGYADISSVEESNKNE